MSNRYAVSDLHGHLDLFNQIKEYIDESDVVYALGDFGDRGPEPWRTLQAVLDDSQFIYLMGNHDLMLIESIKSLLKIPEEEWESEMYFCLEESPFYSLFMNGGRDTLMGWINSPNRMKYYKQLCDSPILIMLPTKDQKHFIHLSHAGYNPDDLDAKTVEDLVWNRHHIHREYKGNDLVIHGHTPIQHMQDINKFLDDKKYFIKDGYCVYSSGKKINIDCGTIASKQTVLLSIDTLEAEVFKIKEVVNETED